MAKLFPKEKLPHLHSTRDTRDRLDLITDNVPVGATRIRADRIIYHPGDTAAKHYHTDCHHLFYILDGEGVIHIDDVGARHAGSEAPQPTEPSASMPRSYRLSPGMVVVVGPGETHWFENDTEENFSFVEFWAPPPKETVWITDDI